jgi:hypothetical protein
MVYRQYDEHPHLVTKHRPSLRQHKISYPLFEEAMLSFLSHTDWKELAKESKTGEETDNNSRREMLAQELDSALKIRSR